MAAINSTPLPPVKVDQETIAYKMSPMLHNSVIDNESISISEVQVKLS